MIIKLIHDRIVLILERSQIERNIFPIFSGRNAKLETAFSLITRMVKKVVVATQKS